MLAESPKSASNLKTLTLSLPKTPLSGHAQRETPTHLWIQSKDRVTVTTRQTL
jgi:hypothetical protein